MSLNSLIKSLPKAELHLHIEGSLEPDLLMALANKHRVSLPYADVEAVKQAYQFEDLQSFLDLYYLGASVLIDEDDFYQLMWCYLQNCKENNVIHTEIMFDPQTHTDRGIEFSVFMNGFLKALEQAKTQWGHSYCLIISFLRHLSEESAFETLKASEPYLQHIDAVGLDSSELGNPPEKFKRVFEAAANLGLARVAHAGEEGPPEYIWSAIKDLQVCRIDHGVRCIEDKALVQYLVEHNIPLTVCPLSNIKLRVFDKMEQHNIFSLLHDGLLVTVNADDPSYFGGYLTDNFVAMQQSLGMSEDDLVKLVKNSFVASLLPADKIKEFVDEVDAVIESYRSNK